MHRPRPTAAATPRPLTTLTWRARVALALMVTLLAGLVSGNASAGAGAADPGAAMTRVVIEARAGLAQVAGAVAHHGGDVVEVLAPFGMVVADVPAGSVGALEDEAATGTVTPDTPLKVQAADVASANRSTVAVPSRPSAGDGVGVVVVDTGIADHPDVADRVVARYVLAPGTEDDPHGHGTFLAGLVAGSGDDDGANAGVAPQAHLVSVRVADATGETTLARVLHGLAVADAARDRHDAPVVLLALSGPTGEVPDPVMMTLEMLWARGSTVVVAAGNGEHVGSPGADPYLLTVGALDDGGTPEADDDVIAPWSARGPSPWGHAKPDLVAPGVSVVGLRAAGSTIDTDNPTARVGDDYFRGSGTSMSAALTAGAAAAVLADDPTLGPDEVKGRLVGSAAPAPDGADVHAAGAGVLDVEAALTSDAPPANGDLAPLPTPRADGRDAAHAVAPGQLRRTADGLEPAGWTWAGWTWAGWTWDGWTWAGKADSDWAGWTWADGEFAGWTWADNAFAGWTWAEDDWAGWTWADNDWAGWSWAGWTWTGWSWSSAMWGDAPG